MPEILPTHLKEIKEIITIKKIAVLGGGHGVHTMAADLALKGFEVNMCETPEFEESIKKTLERQTIDLIDALGKDFYLYRDGTTLSIARGIKSVFEEISKVADAIGVKMLEYPEEDFWKRSTIMSTYFRATFDKDGATAKISGPSSFKSRYYSGSPFRSCTNQENGKPVSSIHPGY